MGTQTTVNVTLETPQAFDKLMDVTLELKQKTGMTHFSEVSDGAGAAMEGLGGRDALQKFDRYEKEAGVKVARGKTLREHFAEGLGRFSKEGREAVLAAYDVVKKENSKWQKKNHAFTPGNTRNIDLVKLGYAAPLASKREYESLRLAQLGEGV